MLSKASFFLLLIVISAAQSSDGEMSDGEMPEGDMPPVPAKFRECLADCDGECQATLKEEVPKCMPDAIELDDPSSF
jgi:hypothetical protein